MASLQRPDGSFCGDAWGEVDTRFSYCALLCLSILGMTHVINVPKVGQPVLGVCCGAHSLEGQKSDHPGWAWPARPRARMKKERAAAQRGPLKEGPDGSV